MGDIGLGVLGDYPRQSADQRAPGIGRDAAREIESAIPPICAGLARLGSIHHGAVVSCDFPGRNRTNFLHEFPEGHFMNDAVSLLVSAGKDLPHLSGPAAHIRQVLAAHFVRDCPHIVEIGGHIRPVTPFLTHHPLSVLSIDPKTPDFEAEELNGRPCRVRHVSKKFQEVEYDYAPRSYGLVLLGYSLKPFGKSDPLGKLLFSLIDNAKIVVIEYPPALERASSQVPQIIGRPTLSVLCSFELALNDAEIAGSPFANRHFYVLQPSGTAA
jgi:hypothetical protein